MIEAFGNIWDHQKSYETIVITTNGYVKANGDAVMGRGIAKEAAERYPWLPTGLGNLLKANGNCFQCICLGPDDPWDEEAPNRYLFMLPVKPEFGPNEEMGWKAKADIALIETSVKQMVEHCKYHDGPILMPRPGCGNGGLKWEDVKLVIRPLLDDRFTVMTFEPE